MKWFRHPAGYKVVAIVAAGLAVGCLGSSPRVSFFTMNALSDSMSTSAPDGLAIGVGPIRVPRYLDQPEWVMQWENIDARGHFQTAGPLRDGREENVL